MSDEDVTKETSQHDFSVSTTSDTKMEMSGQGLVAAIMISAQAVTD